MPIGSTTAVPSSDTTGSGATPETCVQPRGVLPDAVERGAHVVLEALRGVDGDRHGGAVARHRGLELPVRLDDLEVRAQRLDATERGLHAEGGNGQAEEHGSGDASPGEGTGGDGAGEAAPQRVG